MGIIRALGEEAGWEDKKIRRAEGILDVVFIIIILSFGYLGYQQLSMIEECKDVIKCNCPYTYDDLNGSILTLPGSEIPSPETSVID